MTTEEFNQVISRYASLIKKGGNEMEVFFSHLQQNQFDVEVYTQPEVWTVKDILGHIVLSEEQLYPLFVAVSKGEEIDIQVVNIDEENSRNVIDAKLISVEELISRIIIIRKRIENLFFQLNFDSLINKGNHPFLGESNFEDMIKLLNVHTKLHIRDIKRALK